MEYRYAIFYRRLSSHALDGLDNNLLSCLVGRHLGLVHDVVDVTLSIGLGLVLEGDNEMLLGFLC